MATEQLKFSFLSLMGLALCIVPFQYFPWVTGADVYDNQRLLTATCALLAAGLAMYRIGTAPVLYVSLSKRQCVFIAGFFAMGFFASFAAYSVSHAFFEIATFALLGLISWLISEHFRKAGDGALDELLLWCAIACAIYLIVHIGIYVYFMQVKIQPKLSSLFFGYNNIRFFNHIQTISLPLLALFALRQDNSFRRFFWIGVTTLWWAMLFASAGRGSILGLSAGIVISGVLLRQSAIIWITIMLRSAAAGLLAFFVFYFWMPSLRHLQPFGAFSNVVERSLENPTSSRLILWDRAINLMLENSWLGVGPGHFAHHSRDLLVGAHPHNWILQIGSEWGILALVAAICILFFGFTSLRQVDHENSDKEWITQSAFLMGFSAIAIDGMVSGLIVIPGSQLWLAVFFGMAWGWRSSRERNVQLVEWRPTIFVRSGMIACIGFFCFVTVYFINYQRFAISQQPLLIKEGVYMIPRYFLYGYF